MAETPAEPLLRQHYSQELVAERGGPIVVGGHSMGSGTALGVAAQRPDLVNGLWLEDPPLFTSMAEAEHAPTVDSAVALAVLRDWLTTDGVMIDYR